VTIIAETSDRTLAFSTAIAQAHLRPQPKVGRPNIELKEVNASSHPSCPTIAV
jgi:hypothetical protein